VLDPEVVFVFVFVFVFVTHPAMAINAMWHPTTPLLARSKQTWTHTSPCQFSPLVSKTAHVAVSSAGCARQLMPNLHSKNFLVPLGSSFSTRKWRVVGKKQQTDHSSARQWRCSVQEDPQILLSSSMEETYDALARRLLAAALTTLPGTKYMVGIAGPPGAGKSTVAQEVVMRLNELWHKKQGVENGSPQTDIGVAVPMDGFHLYRWQLDAMEDPTEAHARRGAHWTFNPASLIKSLQQLRSQGWAHLPSFDHGVGDPVEMDIQVTHQHQVVVVEGNYLLLEEGDWKSLKSVFDECWFVEIDLDEAMRRVEKRHIATGKPPEIAKWRVGYNDRPNAELIELSKCNADLIIPSISVC